MQNRKNPQKCAHIQWENTRNPHPTQIFFQLCYKEYTDGETRTEHRISYAEGEQMKSQQASQDSSRTCSSSPSAYVLVMRMFVVIDQLFHRWKRLLAFAP